MMQNLCADMPFSQAWSQMFLCSFCFSVFDLSVKDNYTCRGNGATYVNVRLDYLQIIGHGLEFLVLKDLSGTLKIR